MATGTLTGQTIANTYKALLKVTGTTSGGETLHATTLKVIEDGDGNPTPIQLAQNRIEIVPTANHANAFEVSQTDGTQILNINSTTPAVSIVGNATKLYFYDDGDEYVSADNSGNLTMSAGVDLNLTAATDINIPVNVGLRFGDGGENIETDNTDFTITSGGKINLAGDVFVGDGKGVVIGHTAQETISIGDGATDLVPEVQVLGTAQADASLMLAAFSATATSAGAPLLALVKSGDAAIDGTHVIVTDGEELGNIIAYGDDGVDLESPAASIQFEVDGTPGAGDMPGRIIFNTCPDGGSVLTERVRIPAAGGIYEKGGALKENLLTNSGFDVWSNSTLENVGSDLVVNGAFGSNVTGWVGSSGAVAHDTDKMKVTASDAYGYGRTVATISVTAGKLYRLKYKYQNTASEIASVSIYNIQTAGNYANSTYSSLADLPDSTSMSAEQTWTFKAEAGNTTIYLGFHAKNNTDICWFDDISLYEVTPGCVAADALAMDTWYKDSNLDIWRQHWDGTGGDSDKTKAGSFYSLKVTSATTDKYIGFPNVTMRGLDYWLKKVAGRTMTFGCWLKTSTANCGYLRIYDTVTGYTSSSKHTGGDNWEWLEVTATINAASTETTVNPAINVAGTVYFSQPMLVFGSSIGSGNYTRPQGEVIWGEDRHHLNNFSGTSMSDVGNPIELEVESNGKIPKGAKAIYVALWARDSDTATDTPYFRIYGKDKDMWMLGIDMDFADAAGRDDKWTYNYGWVSCEDDGTGISFGSKASGSNTLDVYVTIQGVELR